MQLDTKLQTAIINAISKYHTVDKIIIFGSRARGDANARSDLDVAIVGEKISTREWVEIYDAIDDLDTLLEFDVVRFDTASQDLKQRISNEGVVLYERH